MPKGFFESLKRLVSTRVAEKMAENPEAIDKLRSLGVLDEETILAVAAGTADVDGMLTELRQSLRKLAVELKEQPSLLNDLDVRPIEVLGARLALPETSLEDHPTTVLFTDLEGFTAFTVAEGDRVAARVLDDHYRMIDRLTAGRGGRVWKRLGDGHMLSFPSPQAAVLCSLEMIESAPADLDLRSGAHFGPVVSLHNDLAGTTVNLASRVADSAVGGESLVTEPVREESGVISGVTFGVERTATLKGFGDPVALIPVVRFG
ncbi:hypothetical protein HQ535_02005 [bacterium]|nr:hypothetical protein [bacterium]